jgi:hypothetical protein
LSYHGAGLILKKHVQIFLKRSHSVASQVGGKAAFNDGAFLCQIDAVFASGRTM